jgi:hypothetical protein
MRCRGVAKATPFELEGAISWLERSGEIKNVGNSPRLRGSVRPAAGWPPPPAPS